MKLGRPTKLTPDMQKRICEAIRLGMTRERAAWFCGIHRITFLRWIARGDKATSGKYFEFCEALKKAETEGIAVNLKNIHNAAQSGAWQASAWILERRHPEEYGRNAITASVKADGPVTIEIVSFGGDEP